MKENTEPKFKTGNTRAAAFFTVKDLADRGKDNLPDELKSNTHLIYSSPAALAFNSPGAEGFGVKRAALSIPESVMLLVSPGCCGRNTKLVSDLPGYDNRFFFREMDETDIVTGRHLDGIVKKIREVYDSLTPKPKVIVICITCVDALLGTDMERVCRKAEQEIDAKVIPSYMYALTREGRKPPMVHVRQSLYSVLEPRKKDNRSVNIMGFFAPLADDCELYDILKSAGVTTVNEISRCRTYEEFMTEASANFNIVLNPEARPAALDLEDRLKIPFIELVRLYRPEKIRSQYRAFVNILGGGDAGDSKFEELCAYISSFREKYGELSISVGECLNADPFELSLMLAEQGFKVKEIFGTAKDDNFIYIKKMAEISPETFVYSNLEPTMIYYDPKLCGRVDICLGKDAGYYHPDVPNLTWNSDVQPFGYAGVKRLFESMDALLENRSPELRGFANPMSEKMYESDRPDANPFAPDQSGAVSVLFELGGIQVVCDAGGCAGNICGFDEPRWFEGKSAIFSAGLRDMDAIMGRDDRLANKLSDALEKIDASFAAVIGTPVPSVIGTDYASLKRLVKAKTDIPVLTVNTNGCEYYDRGASKAYVELMREFGGKAQGDDMSDRKVLGVLGLTPLDFSLPNAAATIRAKYAKDGYDEVFTYGMDCGLDCIERAHLVSENIVVSVSGLEAAKYLKKEFNIPYTIYSPLADEYVKGLKKVVEGALTYADDGDPGETPGIGHGIVGKRILVIHEIVTSTAIKKILQEQGAAEVCTATFFMDIKEEGFGADIKLKGVRDLEDIDGFDVVIGDLSLRRFMPGFKGEFYDLPHFALSGRMRQ